MKLFRNSMALVMASACLLASIPGLARAQESSANEPAAVIALQNLEGQLKDIQYLGGKAGFANEVASLPIVAAGFLNGIDKSKPVGASIWFEGEQPLVVGMIPVTNFEDVLDTISANTGQNIEEDGEFYFMATPAAEIVMTVKNGYVFISDSEDHLANIPADPAALLSGVAESNMLAAQLFVQRIPAGLREMAVGQMREGFEGAMEEMEGDLEDLQREANAMQMEQLIDMVENSDQLKIGFGVEQTNEKIVFDMSFTGLEDSKIAKQAAAMQGKASNFGKFLVDAAAFNVNGFGVLLEEDKQNLKTLLDNVKSTAMEEMDQDDDMSDEEKQVVTDLVNDVFGLIQSSIDQGEIDMGATLLSDENDINLALGGSLADTEKFDSLVAKVTELATQQQEVAIEAGKATVSGINFDKLTVTLPDDVDEEVRQMLGDKVVLMMGRSDDAAYFAAGTSPEAAFQTIMDNSSTNGDFPVIYNVRILPILKMVSNNPEAGPVVQQLLDTYGSENDRISIFSKIITNGQKVRGEIDSDLLKLIGLGVKAQQQMGGGADF